MESVELTPTQQRPKGSSNRLFLLIGVAWLVLGGIIMWQLRSAAPTFIRVRWQTETEVDTAGFNIYRSEALDGQCDGLVEEDYVQINNELIPSDGSPVSGAVYSYTDPDIQTNEIYCYLLEDIELGGRTEQHEPILGKAGGKFDRALYIILAPLSFIVGLGLIVQGMKRENRI